MQEMRLTIEEYFKSRENLIGRIHELNTIITQSRPAKEDSSARRLAERRMQLYTELWDIEYAIREMREYLDLTEKIEVAEQVG